MSPSRPGNIFATDFRPKSNIAIIFSCVTKISSKKYYKHPKQYNFSIQPSFHHPPVPNLFFWEMSVLDLPEIPVKNVFRDYASWKLRNTLLRITCQVEWIISIVNDFIMTREWFWCSRWTLDLPEFPVKMCFGDIGIWKFSWPKYSWWSPDSWFSDNVDIFCKKSHRKILPEKKVTTSNFSIIFQNFRMRILILKFWKIIEKLEVVTFFSGNIFRWDFLQNISTLSENHESGLHHEYFGQENFQMPISPKHIFTGNSGKSRVHLEHQNHSLVMIKSFTIDIIHSTWHVILNNVLRSFHDA